jgi:hypothetical protein
MLHEFMYLIPWTLQEEVMRIPRPERYERLPRALFAFQLLLHDVDLSDMAYGSGVSRRSISGVTVAVTFAEDSVWPVLLNTAWALSRFVLYASED